MRKKRIVLGVATVLILAAILSISNTASVRAPGTAYLSVKHAGFTNSISGGRLAVFIVTKQSDLAYVRLAQYWMQSPVSTRRAGTNICRGQVATGEGLIQPGETETLLLTPPTNGSPWRVYLFARRDGNGFLLAVRGAITKLADSLGQRRLADRFRNFELGVPGEWIEP